MMSKALMQYGRYLVGWAIGLSLALLIALGAYDAYYFLQQSEKGDFQLLWTETSRPIFVRTGSTVKDVYDTLQQMSVLKDSLRFKEDMQRLGYATAIPGKYRLKREMTHEEFIAMLKEGKAEMVDIRIQWVRFREDLAGLLSRNLEADSQEVIQFMHNDSFLNSLGYTCENALSMIVSNTYRFKWNVSAQEVIIRLKNESDRVWNSKRRWQAMRLGLSIPEVMSLAAIVQEETAKVEESPRIAGVYLNRLRRREGLFADPTLKFLRLQRKRDEKVKRIYFKDKEVASPYNTYKVKGLPPGPIIVPQLWAIDAVLQPENHQYLFFVAESDFSGYHHFSRDYKEHITYAKLYREALNSRNIY